MSRGLRIELRLAPEWERIELVRQGIDLAVQSVFDEDFLSESLSMAAAELLENAVKYGSRGARTIDLTVGEDDDAVWVQVSNGIDTDSDHAAALPTRIAWIHSFDDPASAYHAALEALFQTADIQSHQSGLGLVRIAHEGDGSIECDTAIAGRVTVRARFRRRTTIETLRPPAGKGGETCVSRHA